MPRLYLVPSSNVSNGSRYNYDNSYEMWYLLLCGLFWKRLEETRKIDNRKSLGFEMFWYKNMYSFVTLVFVVFKYLEY